MGYIYRRCRLVSQNLSEPQKIDRLRQSHELLEILQNTKRFRWRLILTGNESKFCYVNEHRKFWVSPDSDIPEVAEGLINTAKVMITLAWNPAKLPMSDFLTGESSHGDYFMRNVLTLIHLLPIVAAAHKQKRFILDMDDSPIDKSKVMRVKLSQMLVHLALHHLYSPDLTPSDVFIFGYLKEKMLRLELDSAEDLFHWIGADNYRVFHGGVASASLCIPAAN
jgi:hypothetical protein